MISATPQVLAPISGHGMAIGNAPADRFAPRPDTHSLALLDHANELSACGIAQRLNSLDDDLMAQCRIRYVELALGHRTFCDSRVRQFAIA